MLLMINVITLSVGLLLHYRSKSYYVIRFCYIIGNYYIINCNKWLCLSASVFLHNRLKGIGVRISKLVDAMIINNPDAALI